MQIQKLLLLLLCSCTSICAKAEIIYYESQSLHLNFTLNTETKEAKVGNDLDYEHTAQCLPPFDDPWYETYPKPNFWEHVVVPSQIDYQGEMYIVTGVAYRAFARMTEVKTIELPTTIRNFDNEAFYCCVNLESINIPEGVVGIPTGAFEYCKNLKEINLPSTIGGIGSRAFHSCYLFKSITIPGACLRIEDDAFVGCRNIETVVLEDGNTPLYLGKNYSLYWDFQVGDGTKYRGPAYRGLFADCPVKNVYIGRTTINPVFPRNEVYSPFEECYPLDYDVYGSQAIQHEGKILESITFGDNVEEISEKLFYRSSFDSFRNPNAHVTLPSKLRIIHENAFYETLIQQELTIPASCTDIRKCNLGNNLKIIHCEATTPPNINDYITGLPFPSNIVVYIPDSTRNVYSNHEIWGKYYKFVDPADELVAIDVKIPGQLYGRLSYNDYQLSDVFKLKVTGNLSDDDLSTINSMDNLYELDFSETNVETDNMLSTVSRHLVTVNFSNSIKEISSYYTNLTGRLVVPPSCTTLGGFGGSMLEEVTINGPVVVKGSTFWRNKNLKKVFIQGEGAKLNQDAFSQSNVRDLILGEGVVVSSNSFDLATIDTLSIVGNVENIECALPVTKRLVMNGSIRYNASDFYSTLQNLESIEISDLKSWCEMSIPLEGSNPLATAQTVTFNNQIPEEVIIPEGTQMIGDHVFEGCKTITSVRVPQSVNTIGNGSFRGCTNLSDITLTSNVESIGQKAFQNCSSLLGINIPEPVKEIETSCFENCTALKNIGLSDAVEGIKEKAFYNCTSLEEIELPGTLRSIGNSAFRYCTSLNNLIFPSGITSISDYAFSDCSNLREMYSKLLDPVVINTNVFDAIHSKGCLWVPINSGVKYYQNGWGHIPLIDEGFCLIQVDKSLGINMEINEGVLGADGSAMIDYGAAADIRILLDENYYLKSVKLDGNDIINDLHDDMFTLSDVKDNIAMQAYAKKFVFGDVNDDDYVDVGDISAIVKLIQQTPEPTFIKEAADVNNDGDIDVGDITGTVNLIYDNSNVMRARSSNYADFECRIDGSIDGDGILSLYLVNETAVSGIQFEITLAEGMHIPVDEKGNFRVYYNAERIGDMNIKSITLLPNGNYLFLCSSTNKKGIELGAGKILDIAVELETNSILGQQDLSLTNIRMSDINANVHHQDNEIILSCRDNTSGVVSTYSDIDKACKYISNGSVIIKKDGIRYSLNGNKK